MCALRVLYVTKFTGGGAAVSLAQLITQLRFDRCEPIVLCQRVFHPEFVDRLKGQGIQVFGLPGSPGPESLKAARAPRRREAAGRGGRLRRLGPQVKAGHAFVRQELRQAVHIARAIRQVRPDLIHSNAGVPASRPVILAARLAGLPCICHARVFDQLTWLDRSLARWVAHFIYNSSAVAQSYAAQGIPAAQGEVIHNAVGPEAFCTPEESRAARRRLGICGGDFVVVNVGRLVPWKGQDVFLRAMAQAAPKVEALRCFVVGEPDGDARSLAFAEGLPALAEQLGLSGRVTFTGFRSDALDFVKASEVVVHSSSRPEPFGRVIVEAMAAGRPVVATRGGGVPEIVEHGWDGLMVPMDDAVGMAEAVLRLWAHPAWARTLGARAQAKAQHQFTAEQHAERVQQVYHAVLARVESRGAGRVSARARAAEPEQTA